MTAQAEPLENAIDQLSAEAEGGRVSVGDLLDRLEKRPMGLILVALGLLVSLPVIGAIPGLPNIVALAVVATVAHSWFGGGTHFYAPTAIRERTVDAGSVRAVLARVRPAAEWVDGLVVNQRLAFLAKGEPARTVASGAALLLAIILIPVSFVPGLAAVPGIGIVLLGLALAGEDGIFAGAGYLFMAGSIALLGWVIGSVF
ncbi:MAG: exopolysaccharide biosynthesis protein [Paracoccaceae bacterium]